MIAVPQRQAANSQLKLLISSELRAGWSVSSEDPLTPACSAVGTYYANPGILMIVESVDEDGKAARGSIRQLRNLDLVSNKYSWVYFSIACFILDIYMTPTDIHGEFHWNINYLFLYFTTVALIIPPVAAAGMVRFRFWWKCIKWTKTLNAAFPSNEKIYFYPEN